MAHFSTLLRAPKIALFSGRLAGKFADALRRFTCFGCGSRCVALELKSRMKRGLSYYAGVQRFSAFLATEPGLGMSWQRRYRAWFCMRRNKKL